MKLIITNLDKQIKKQPILRSINAQFNEGEIIAINGHNGSGKTVLLRTLCGLLLPTNGTVQVWHENHLVEHPTYGLVSDEPKFWGHYTGYEVLQFLYRLQQPVQQAAITEALQRVGLEEMAHQSIKRYSLGMRQKLLIAQAIMEKPNILLFDEPTNGLDDEALQKFEQILREERDRGAVVIVTSHYREWLAKIGQRFFKMNNGQLTEEYVHETIRSL